MPGEKLLRDDSVRGRKTRLWRVGCWGGKTDLSPGRPLVYKAYAAALLGSAARFCLPSASRVPQCKCRGEAEAPAIAVLSRPVHRGRSRAMLFDGASLIVSKPRGILLDTRMGHPISNEVLPPLSESEQRKLDDLHDEFGDRWEPRKPHTPGYNCAGHVWASRRTSILEDSAIRLILGDDGYRRLRPDEGALQGDLVLYWNVTTGGQQSWLHIGVVSELRTVSLAGAELLGREPLRVPWVLSKWSSFHGEWLHKYDDAPYRWDGVVIEFFTDRP